ncbi:lysoplasmalogenase TMEM86A-like [Heterodontus francisci]|uniref:lysoplasmalogenase TMEM86A-like n=1 Tax=Heterodontus francisci TaxID=7792 RepID=UPI00355C9202
MEFYKVVLPFALALFIRYEYGLPEHPPNLSKVLLKILPVLILMAVILQNQRASDFSLRLTAGLGFAAAGDLCQLYKDQYFNHGVICFGIAYCLFAAAFGLRSDHLFLGCLTCLVALAIYYFVSPGVRGLSRPAAIAYTLPILIMLWRAMAWWRISQHNSSLSALFGAITLVISNTVLSTHLFQFPVPHSDFLVSSSYYMGQLLIAMSAV